MAKQTTRACRRRIPRNRITYTGARMACGREVDMIIEGKMVGFREKGRRTVYWMTIGGLAMHAARVHAEAAKPKRRRRVSRGLIGVER